MKFSVTLYARAALSATVEVEADDEDDAIDAAEAAVTRHDWVTDDLTVTGGDTPRPIDDESDDAEVATSHSEVAIWEGQNREDARADEQGRKPRCLASMADVAAADADPTGGTP